MVKWLRLHCTSMGNKASPPTLCFPRFASSTNSDLRFSEERGEWYVFLLYPLLWVIYMCIIIYIQIYYILWPIKLSPYICWIVFRFSLSVPNFQGFLLPSLFGEGLVVRLESETLPIQTARVPWHFPCKDYALSARRPMELPCDHVAFVWWNPP